MGRSPAWLAALQETSLFGPAVETIHTRALQLDLDKLLQPTTHTGLVQETFFAMAPATT